MTIIITIHITFVIGKTHHQTPKGPAIFDVNSKLPVACVHAGIGQETLNNLLSTLNIHLVSNGMWVRRLSEVGSGFMQVAERSVSDALQKEKDATIACQFKAVVTSNGSESRPVRIVSETFKNIVSRKSNGIFDLFSERKSNNKPRVTSCKKITQKVQDFLTTEEK